MRRTLKIERTINRGEHVPDDDVLWLIEQVDRLHHALLIADGVTNSPAVHSALESFNRDDGR